MHGANMKTNHSVRNTTHSLRMEGLRSRPTGTNSFMFCNYVDSVIPEHLKMTNHGRNTSPYIVRKIKTKC